MAKLQELVDSYMQQNDGIPNRRISLLAGLIGGVVGIAAARYYWLHITPILFPETPLADEPPTRAVAQKLYEQVSGQPPTEATIAQFANGLQWLYGIGAGGAYGGSRTSTRWRDIAGGFWYGIRLWLADEVFTPILGLRPWPTQLPLIYHVKRLTAYHVYTFTMSAVTRVLYRLLAGERD